jgi:hypothetical protein
MPAKQLRYRESARHTMLAGVEQLAKAVKVTLGLKGRHVVLDKKWGAPTITKDGVTVAEETELAASRRLGSARRLSDALSKNRSGNWQSTSVLKGRSLSRKSKRGRGIRLQHRHRHLRRLDGLRRRRSDQGDSLGTAECFEYRGVDADDGSAHHRTTREERDGSRHTSGATYTMRNAKELHPGF